MGDHTELMQRVLSCAVNEFEGFACSGVSSWVVRAVRPSGGGSKTDMGIFGLCSAHKPDWEAVMEGFGYVDGMCVEWAGVGMVFDDLRRMGYLKFVEVSA